MKETEIVEEFVQESVNPDSNEQEDVVISVQHVSKKFCRNLRRSMAYGIVDLSKDLFGIKPDSSILRKDEFWALEDVSFELRRGETLGIIGINGSGKTTLLRLLTGIFPPDKGKIAVKGRIGALVAVGAGFHPHMTGRENIYLNGVILGMSRKQIEERFEMITDFAEIGDFLDAPVSTYSSGMRVRLGFAIAVHVDPDILLIDEVLSVGDLSFRNKSVRKLHELRKKAKGIIFVSHNMDQVLNVSDRIIILDKGRMIFEGETEEAIILYHQITNEIKYQSMKKEIEKSALAGQHISSGDIDVLDIGIMDEATGKKITSVPEGENITAFVHIETGKLILKPRIAIGIREDRNFNIIWQVNREKNAFYDDLKPGKYCLTVTFVNPSLEANTYKVVLGIQDVETLEYFEKFALKGQNVFKVVGNNKIPRGIVSCESYWKLAKL